MKGNYNGVIKQIFWNRCNPSFIMRLFYKIKYYETPLQKRRKRKVSYEMKINNILKERRRILKDIYYKNPINSSYVR